MNALIVDLERVRHAVWLSDFMGMPETRQAVVSRQVADARDAQRIAPTQPVREQVISYGARDAQGGAK
jgi:hypothetical protein